jgi:hypothetical protein
VSVEACWDKKYASSVMDKGMEILLCLVPSIMADGKEESTDR